MSEPPYDSLNLAAYVGDDPAAVAANLVRVAAAVGTTGLAVMDAVHGAQVAVVTVPGVVPDVDALVTSEPHLALLALGADCVPIGLIADDGRTVAAVHCGWRGLVGDVVGAVVAHLADTGCRVDAAVLGASVCGSCYPVPPARALEVARACTPATSAAALVTCPDGQPGIDVAAGVRARLVELGVAPDVIVSVGGCTVEDPGLFSYRRDGVTGRQGIAIARMDAIARMEA